MSSPLRRALATVAVAAVAAGALISAAGPAQAAGPRPLFQLPFACGEQWQLSTYNGHGDYDIDMTRSGGTWDRPIIASYAGQVTFAGLNGSTGNRTPSNPNGPQGSGGGYMVNIDHGNGWSTEYLHMIRPPSVSTGQSIAQGQVLGNVGSTGDSSGPHLHYAQSRDGVVVQSYLDGQPVDITDDARANSFPLTSHNCGTSAPSPVFESASSNGWAPQYVSGASGQVTGTAVAAINHNGVKFVYTVKDGTVYEAHSADAWRNSNTGIPAPAGSPVAALSVGGTKYVYTIRDGVVYEASSSNSWISQSTGVGATAVSAIEVNGVKYLYTLLNGKAYESASNNSWAPMAVAGTSGQVYGTALAAINHGGVKLLYTVNGGVLHEATSANSWANASTGRAVSGSTVSAISVNGTKLVYTLVGGKVHEASSANGWANLNTGVPAVTVAAINVPGAKTFYTL